MALIGLIFTCHLLLVTVLARDTKAQQDFRASVAEDRLLTRLLLDANLRGEGAIGGWDPASFERRLSRDVGTLAATALPGLTLESFEAVGSRAEWPFPASSADRIVGSAFLEAVGLALSWRAREASEVGEVRVRLRQSDGDPLRQRTLSKGAEVWSIPLLATSPIEWVTAGQLDPDADGESGSSWTHSEVALRVVLPSRLFSRDYLQRVSDSCGPTHRLDLGSWEDLPALDRPIWPGLEVTGNLAHLDVSRFGLGRRRMESGWLERESSVGCVFLAAGQELVLQDLAGPRHEPVVLFLVGAGAEASRVRLGGSFSVPTIIVSDRITLVWDRDILGPLALYLGPDVLLGGATSIEIAQLAWASPRVHAWGRTQVRIREDYQDAVLPAVPRGRVLRMLK